jgi:signal transduction histidine kinase
MIVGLGITIGIWVFAGYFFGRRIADLEGRTSAVSARYIMAQDLLTQARTNILLTSVYARDAFLLYSDPETASDNRRRIDGAFRAAEQALERYTPVLNGTGNEPVTVKRLRLEIGELRVTMLDVLASDRRTWATQAGSLLQQRVRPKREAVLRVAEELQALNRQAYVDHQEEVAAIYVLTQRRVWLSLGLAVLGSLMIGLLAWLYAGLLEKRIQQQRERDALNARDLQRLSAQLLSAQEEERRSLARELHDEVGQTLTAMKLELKSAQQALVAAGQAPDLLEDARAIADRALHTVRDLSHLLHPSMLDDLGLPAAVEWFVNGLAKHHQTVIELVQQPTDGRAAPETEAAAYRIVQEGVHNVLKHAHATNCRVTIQRVQDQLTVVIADNGVGFNVTASAEPGTSRGLGLVGMRERAARLDGVLQIESAPGAGTTVTATLPTRTAPSSGSWPAAQVAPQLAESTG